MARLLASAVVACLLAAAVASPSSDDLLGDCMEKAKLQRDDPIDQGDEGGYTVLHMAVAHNDEACLLAAVTAGADVSARTHDDGWTPLHVAAAMNKADGIRMLLAAAGRDIHHSTPQKEMLAAKCNIGGTPLHWAAKDGAIASVFTLIAHGADVEAQAQNGATPIFWAALDGHEGVVELLLEKNANAHHKDAEGHTVKDIAAAGCKQLLDWINDDADFETRPIVNVEPHLIVNVNHDHPGATHHHDHRVDSEL